MRHHLTAQAVVAGLVCALVGFTSSFAVVVAGLRAVGASPAQAASGLLALCLTMGLGCVLFSWRLRMPVTMAWSTPGAAMLAGAAAAHGGFAAAAGAFLVAGALLALAGFVRPLARLMGAVPGWLASAMLAGVLLPLCAAPVTAVVHDAAHIAPPVLVWLLARRWAPRWAVPLAVAAAGAVILTAGMPVVGSWWPAPSWSITAPSAGDLLAISLPLYLVTMTSQNLPGIGVLASFGYQVEPRGPLAYTGLATMAGAPFGGHAVNLAAISAALAAGPEAGPDPDRRWVAGVTCGLTYCLFGLCSGPVLALAAVAPAGLLATIAGLALLGTLAASLSTALAGEGSREAAAATIVVGASGVVVAGIGAAFWALVVGYLAHLVLRRPA